MSNLSSNNFTIELLNNIDITNKTYYKMKYFINYLDKNTTIKKKKDTYIIKNNISKNKEIITDEYLEKQLYNFYKNNKNNNNLCIIESNLQYTEIYVMGFLLNALNDGWSIRKKDINYVFRKKHENKKEIYSNDYLTTFLKNNFNINNIN